MSDEFTQEIHVFKVLEKRGALEDLQASYTFVSTLYKSSEDYLALARNIGESTQLNCSGEETGENDATNGF